MSGAPPTPPGRLHPASRPDGPSAWLTGTAASSPSSRRAEHHGSRRGRRGRGHLALYPFHCHSSSTGSQVRLVLMPGAGLPGFSSAEEELPICAYARLTPPTAKRTMLSGVTETEWQGVGQSGPPGVSSQVCCLHPGDQSQPAIS